jgi:thymidylate kinase
LLEREDRERDYEEEKDKTIIGLYRELANKDLKSIIINNNGSIEEAVNKIYNGIVGV